MCHLSGCETASSDQRPMVRVGTNTRIGIVGQGIMADDSGSVRMADLRRVRHLVLVIALALRASGVLVAQSTTTLPAVFTAADASKGKDLYIKECASCHGGRLHDGTAVALVGRAFLQKWSHPLVTLDDLFYTIQNTMPKNRGNALTPADYMAVVAYLMEQNGYPAGAQSQLGSAQQRRSVRFVAAAAAAVPEFIPGSDGSRPATSCPRRPFRAASAARTSTPRRPRRSSPAVAARRSFAPATSTDRARCRGRDGRSSSRRPGSWCCRRAGRG